MAIPRHQATKSSARSTTRGRRDRNQLRKDNMRHNERNVYGTQRKKNTDEGYDWKGVKVLRKTYNPKHRKFSVQSEIQWTPPANNSQPNQCGRRTGT